MPVNFELNPAYIVYNKQGQVSTNHYISGPAGEFSLTGNQETVPVDNGDGTTSVRTIEVPTQQQLQETYDNDPKYADLIIPADGHIPPWAP